MWWLPTATRAGHYRGARRGVPQPPPSPGALGEGQVHRCPAVFPPCVPRASVSTPSWLFLDSSSSSDVLSVSLPPTEHAFLTPRSFRAWDLQPTQQSTVVTPGLVGPPHKCATGPYPSGGSIVRGPVPPLHLRVRPDQRSGSHLGGTTPPPVPLTGRSNTPGPVGCSLEASRGEALSPPTPCVLGAHSFSITPPCWTFCFTFPVLIPFFVC